MKSKLHRLRNRLSYANVAATLALFLALGGSVYATTLAPRNSVGSKAIINGQVKSPDLAPGVKPAHSIEVFRQPGPDEPAGSALETLATIHLAPGSYTVFGKATLVPNANSAVLCELANGNNDLDESASDILSLDAVTENVQANVTTESHANVVLACTAFAGTTWHSSHISIVAIKVPSASRTAVTG